MQSQTQIQRTKQRRYSEKKKKLNVFITKQKEIEKFAIHFQKLGEAVKKIRNRKLTKTKDEINQKLLNGRKDK